MQSFLFDETPPESGETLEEVNAELLQRAKTMPQLAERVFILGEGRPGARAAVVGESPGPPDADSGRPFMGPAGQMLERILGSINLKREECYLTNTVKIISSGDEMTPELLSLFTPYLHRELAAVRPQSLSLLAIHRRVRCSALKSLSHNCAANFRIIMEYN